MYRYMEPNTNKTVIVEHKAGGSVTIYKKEQAIATHHSDNIQDLERWAEEYLAFFDPILSREDYYNLSYHISFGISPEHRYM